MKRSTRATGRIEITEVPWPKDVPRELSRKQLWEARLSEINKLRPPEGKAVPTCTEQHV